MSPNVQKRPSSEDIKTQEFYDSTRNIRRVATAIGSINANLESPQLYSLAKSTSLQEPVRIYGDSVSPAISSSKAHSTSSVSPYYSEKNESQALNADGTAFANPSFHSFGLPQEDSQDNTQTYSTPYTTMNPSNEMHPYPPATFENNYSVLPDHSSQPNAYSFTGSNILPTQSPSLNQMQDYQNLQQNGSSNTTIPSFSSQHDLSQGLTHQPVPNHDEYAFSYPYELQRKPLIPAHPVPSFRPTSALKVNMNSNVPSSDSVRNSSPNQYYASTSKQSIPSQSQNLQPPQKASVLGTVNNYRQYQNSFISLNDYQAAQSNISSPSSRFPTPYSPSVPFGTYQEKEKSYSQDHAELSYYQQSPSMMPPYDRSSVYFQQPLSRTDVPNQSFQQYPTTVDGGSMIPNLYPTSAEQMGLYPQDSQNKDTYPKSLVNRPSSAVCEPARNDSIPMMVYSQPVTIEQRIQYVLSNCHCLSAFYLCMPSLCQKSYGTERRYLCPPIVLYLLGTTWLNNVTDNLKISAQTLEDKDNPKFAKNIFYYNADGALISPETDIAKSTYQLTNYNENTNFDSFPVWGNALLKTIYYTGQGKNDGFGRSTFLQLSVQSKTKYFKLENLRLGVISKPSQKRALMKVSDMSIRHGDCVCLFNRYRAQHNNALFLGTSNVQRAISKVSLNMKYNSNYFPTTDAPNDAENEGAGLAMANNLWEPFYIFSVDELNKGNNSNPSDSRSKVLCSNMVIILVSKITGVQSPPLILKKHDNWKVSLSSRAPSEAINCLSKLAFQCHETKRFLYIDEKQSSEISFTSGELEYSDPNDPTKATHSVLPWSAMWSIISTQSVRTMFYNEPIHQNAFHVVPSMPFVKFIRLDENSMFHIYGTGFANDVQIWMAYTRCEVKSINAFKPDTTLPPDIISDSRFSSRVYACTANLIELICEIPVCMFEPTVELSPILLFQYETLFHSGYKWPLESH
ncbi:DNA-binding transcription factor, CBF1/Su(H)/LAG-1 family Cbf12 [Schizosaccharomyces pombe]|uniref:Transcription factor cbf12 n=1 Tax=Schizosaccharomyces pombe (strain 972 / ATCC 24843) TaxID=284812 RepID=CBF12_SCHPO|nr:CBF1/Su(H)/LAG-1 family transcription factor Cbf12 [Schizosaccharomyces pombe]O74412.1 RecName: Full=Transcription factor cbf12; AltName: Full=C-promoter element-binding factor-like protein 12 [Schizosaccharomyces pombe 972h-]CAA20882.1 CBF1/Su(H)/LAG-1 family transcription factor Cbf12 [Schizosaccharomyces pombe]|eukprot:NP_588358.1 CBF1/Su(H)/LAG-1 family transcription factor Cbf12 [Schizosaccharomyces pombe]